MALQTGKNFGRKGTTFIHLNLPIISFFSAYSFFHSFSRGPPVRPSADRPTCGIIPAGRTPTARRTRHLYCAGSLLRTTKAAYSPERKRDTGNGSSLETCNWRLCISRPHHQVSGRTYLARPLTCPQGSGLLVKKIAANFLHSYEESFWFLLVM